MIVCQCTGVTDRTLQDVIRAGATTVREVGRRCGAGRYCTACRSEIAARLAAAERPPTRAASRERADGLI
jgi:bacterioferritin-associated ferredoxin